MFVSFAITELLAFDLQIFMESRDPDHPLLPSYGIQKRCRFYYEPL